MNLQARIDRAAAGAAQAEARELSRMTDAELIGELSALLAVPPEDRPETFSIGEWAARIEAAFPLEGYESTNTN